MWTRASATEQNARLEGERTILRSPNWPLRFGGTLVLAILCLAWWGPSLAPKDPMESTAILQVNGQWSTPPFPPLTPGFPIGSDQFGRDLLSQLLWAIRPTLVMVIIIAVVRLGLGVSIGMVAGWTDRGIGRIADFLIANALSVPVIIVALIVVAGKHTHPDLAIFIFALSLTGWADTAQIIKQQTIVIRQQPFIEAAEALGADRGCLFVAHVLPHLLPYVWIQLPFEVSSVQLIIGGLGFLGYYINQGIMISIDGTLSRKAIVYPELGQMLASTLEITTAPFGMVAAGSMVFLIVLGFHLLGLGLRQRWDRYRYGGAPHSLPRLNLWLIEELLMKRIRHIIHRRARRWRVGLAAVVIIIGGLWLARWASVGSLFSRSGNPPSSGPSSVSEARPSPTSSLPEQKTSVNQPSAKLVWEYELPDRLRIPPIPGPAGNLFVMTQSGKLLALNREGQMIGEITLPETDDFVRIALPTPISEDAFLYYTQAAVYAIGASGEVRWKFEVASDFYYPAPWKRFVYIVEDHGKVYQLDFEQGLVWHFSHPQGLAYHLQDGPAVDDHGNVYVALRSTGETDSDLLFALSPEGNLLWQVGLPPRPARLTGGQVLFSPVSNVLSFDGLFIDALTGTVFDLQVPEQAESIQVNPLGQFVITSGGSTIAYDFSSGKPKIVTNPTPALHRKINGHKFVGLLQQPQIALWCHADQEHARLHCLLTASSEPEEVAGEFTVEGIPKYRYIQLAPDMTRMYIYTDSDGHRVIAVNFIVP